jgi:putative endonuclease
MNGNEGAAFERAAEKLLNLAGLTTTARNWSCRLGEIDLIMQDGATTVFVEVRKRKTTLYGSALESINAAKLSKLTRAIEMYLSSLPVTPPCRIDAITFDGAMNPVWHKNVAYA